MPLSIVSLLFLIGLFFLFSNKIKKAKIYLSFSFLLLFLFSYEPFSNYITKNLENQYPSYIQVDKSIKYLLVLGSGHTTNPELSPLSQMSQTAMMRLGEGIRIYKELEDAKLIVSGFGGNDKTAHAIISKKVAISLGVDEKNIITQEKAKDTFEEAVYAKKTIGDEKFILVTSATHMPRSMQIFKNTQMNPIAAPTNYYSKEDGEFLSYPQVSELEKTTISMHEYLGISYYKILDFIKGITN